MKLKMAVLPARLEEKPKADAMATTFQQKWWEGAYHFSQKVRDLGSGPLTLRLVFGKPGGDSVCAETRGPGGLDERGATAVAIATAFALRRSGFDDARVAVSNTRRDAVAMKFTDDGKVEVVEYRASTAC